MSEIIWYLSFSDWLILLSIFIIVKVLEFSVYLYRSPLSDTYFINTFSYSVVFLNFLNYAFHRAKVFNFNKVLT